MRSLLLLSCLLLPCLSHAADIAVLSVAVEGEAKRALPSLIDDYLLTAVSDLTDGDVVGPSDVNAMIGFEKQKELLGCTDVSCMAEIAGALGVDRIVSFAVARVDGDWATTAKLMDVRNARVEARTTGFVPGGARELLSALPSLVQKLFAAAEGPSPQPGPELVPKSLGAAPSPSPTNALRPELTEGPVYQQTWFWLAVGGVVAAAVVGVAVASSIYNDEPPTTRSTIDLATTSERL